MPALSESCIFVVKVVEAGTVVAKEKAFDHVRGPVSIVVVGSEVQLPQYLSFVSAMHLEQMQICKKTNAFEKHISPESFI